ncbi:GNAT family N-acetyltransferase [Haladaptatus sp. DYF46]|uniref:GNAT family N-acetyltransferase n=1 Tax=Haladaptatus sp. DYF46 TaxID=2886041 RepID=UPI001E2E480F
MNIRPLESETDLRGAIRTNGRAWKAAYDDIVPESVIERVAASPTDERLDALFEAVRNSRYFVAVDETDSVRGYAYFRWGDDETKEFVGADEAGLKEIYVDPDDWGRGIGTALLEHGLARLPESITALKLEALSENDSGKRFYTARGFEPIKESTITIADESYSATIYSLSL